MVPPALQLSGDKFVTSGNYTEVGIKGISWYGFNNNQTMVDGLYVGWSGGTTAMNADFATIVYRYTFRSTLHFYLKYEADDGETAGLNLL